MKKPILLIVALLMAIVGFVWIFQGLNVIKGSFMTGQIFWTFMGLIMMAGAGGLFWLANRKPVS